MINVSSCPHCNSKHLFVWSNSPQFNKCIQCGLIFQDQLPTQNELESFYSKYHDSIHQSEGNLNEQRLVSYQLDLDFLKESLKIHHIDINTLQSVFDYGASGGYLLDAFSPNFVVKAGWDYGVQSKQVLKSKGYYTDFENNKSDYDLLVMRGVIEHMRNPWAELKNIIINTKPRYILITATPNGSSIAASIYRDQWHMHLPTEHIYHFSPHHLLQIICPYGYRMLNLDYKYLSTPYSNFAADSVKILHASRTSSDVKSAPYFDSMINCVFQKFE